MLQGGGSMRDLSNISSLIGSLNNNNNNFINLTDYNNIKSGSYAKLMKAYYAEEAKTAKTQKTSSAKTSKVKTQADDPELTKVKANADTLKTSASKLSSSELWEPKEGKVDTEKVMSAVKDFIKDYNTVVEQAGKVTSKEVANNTKWMTGLSSTLSKTLGKAGITVGADNKLTLNEETFKKASTNTLESLFKGSNSYAGQVEAKANGISNASLMSSATYGSDASVTSTLASLFNTNI